VARTVTAPPAAASAPAKARPSEPAPTIASRAVRHRRVQAVQAAHRRVEVVEAALHHLSPDLGADAARRVGLVDDQQPTGLVDRGQDRVDVERRERARVDHLDLEAVLRQRVGGLERLRDHAADRDDARDRAVSGDRGLAERYEVLALRHRPAPVQERLVLKEDDRVVRAYRALEQPLRVGRRRRDDDPEAGLVDEERVVAARVMCRGRAAGAHAAAQHDRDLQAAVRHVLQLRGLVDQLAHRVEDEVDEHEIDDRPGAARGRAGAHADEAALGDRGVAQPLRPVLLVQPERRLEVAAARADALADDEDCRVALHLLGQPLARRRDVGQLPHFRGSPEGAGPAELAGSA
jgi:hypothetical protein